MGPNEILEGLKVVLAILGVIGLAGTVIVGLTPGNEDDTWWAKHILPIMPALTMGNKANKIQGNKSIPFDKLLALSKKSK